MHSESTYIDAHRVFQGSIPLVMGTRFDLLVHDISPSPAKSLWIEVCSLLERLDRMLDRFNPSSEVSRLNAGKTSSLSPELQSIIEICSGCWLRTCGLFDITRKDFSALRWRVGAINLGGLSLDFGGIAKGLVLRQIQDLLERRGATCAFVDFGGSSILAVGKHPFGPCWEVEVKDPYTGALLETAALKDCSLSTSGNRPGYSGHIVNPADGKACDSRRLVTVKAPDPLDAEVLSTVMMIASPEQEAAVRQNYTQAIIKRYEL
ncbi:MAG: FAD:protein FMN transferase [Bacteroidales bacterium]|nr:FAD:protein FMN transferase [Bacteroidales bacterium]